MRLRIWSLICGLVSVMLIGGCGVTYNESAVLTIVSSLPPGTVNVAYSATLSVTGGTAPYTWSIVSGSLPTGLSLSSGGVISGTPTAVGSAAAKIQVKDSSKIVGTATLTATIVIDDSAVTISTSSPLTPGTLNAAYSATLAASGGTPPYTWSLTSGSLPAGLTLSSAGVIAGIPTTYGSSSFTVQASDSASTPQSASAALVLEISGGVLAITTTSLPAGTQAIAYSAQLAATGGVPPYSWSLSPAVPLPAGLTFSATGLLSGTPAGASNSDPIFTVVDSAGDAVAEPLNLLIQPTAVPIADATYAFVFGGTSPQGTPTVTSAIVMNGTFTVKGGAVVSGFYDANTNSGSAVIEQPITGGTLIAYSNGQGRLVLEANGSKLTFALAIPPSATPGGKSDIRIIEFDDANGTGTRGSGVLKPALANPTTAGIQGNFAFLLSGSDINQNEQALIGSFQTDGDGTILGGLADANEAGTLASFPTVQGTYSVDANGRGAFVLALAYPVSGNLDYHYSFYEVSPGELLTISTDPATLNSPLVSGSVLQQTGPFNNSSLTGASVVELSGLAQQVPTRVPDITVGLATADGNGNLALNLDEYNGAFLPGQSSTYTYAVDPVTGRTPTNSVSGPGPTLYLIDGTRAFALGADASASSGMLELQSVLGLSNASFHGKYLGGSLPLINTSVLNEDGIVAADGNGNLLFTTDRSGPLGLVQFQNVAGAYAVDATGRVVVTTPDGDTRIFYIVSPTKVAYLTSDSGGYLGIFEQ